jgi:Cu2+-exporting ATPase
MPTCKHCLLEFPEPEAVRDREDVFCCPACRGIYRLINDEGLEEFYDKRDTRLWRPGPMSASEVGAPEAAAFEGMLRRVGESLEAVVTIEGIRCASCVWLNEKMLLRSGGVESATVNYATHRARVRFDPELTSIAEVLGRIAALGYLPKPYRPETAELELKERRRDLLLRFGTAAFFSMQLMMYSAALYAGYFEGQDASLRRVFEIISLALCTPVLFYSGRPFFSASLRGLRNLVFNMDVLVAIGSGAAYLYSIYNMLTDGEVFFDTSAMIITFVLLGRYIEAGAKGRASESVSRLLGLSPSIATLVLPDGARKSTPVSSIRAGDIIEVSPGERIALDGTVESGLSECDESMLTGESMPVEKGPGEDVFAGTVNGLGSLLINVTGVGDDTVLSRIVRAVEEAQARRAPVQVLADRVVGLFVPGIILLAMVTFAIRLYSGLELSGALMNSVSVLVIACPCALGLATPLAIVVATASGASKGILIRGGEVIELASALKAAVLDKTGTVTAGRPELVHSEGLGSTGDSEALLLMASLEQRSEHLTGRAIAEAAPQEGRLEPEGFRAHPGQGISGRLMGEEALAGSREFLISRGVSGDFPETSGREAGGESVVFLALGGRLAGAFSVSDPVRPEASEAVKALKEMGMSVSLLTGDNERTARAVAAGAGIDEVRAGMSPIEKAAMIRELKVSTSVVMAGDGINDAPALVEATVGVAVGRATDVALESADMVLMRDDLMLLPDALRLSRKAFSVIRQNIFWAFAYNLVAVPLAVAGLLHPIVAAGAMALSSLSVVGNSLRARIK